MAFDVIPAIDVFDGKLARFSGGAHFPVEEFGGDPLAAAEAFAQAGASWVHVVDMNLAFQGASANADVVARVSELGLKVQASGGVASHADIEQMLEGGAERVVLGSAALENRMPVEMLVAELGERLAVGLEIDGSRIVPRGRAPLEISIGGTVDWLVEIGATRFVRTSVARVGERSGPNLEGITELVATGRPVVAAGGIGSFEHLQEVAATGAEGAIVGRSVYEGDLDLATAIRELAAA
ncbi:MAG: HisA/HisF-related TIM barrel protein [Actinomycetota bacterium]